MLRALLSRSDPLPFSFSWDRPYGWDAMPEDVAELVCSNMHRMRACAVSGACLDLVWQPAPMLAEFDGQEADGPADLASRWPVIKLLWLRSLSILPSAPQRFAAVVLFSCWEISEFAHARTPLFSVFPALETLSIGHIMQEEVGCLSNPPDCLAKLSIGVVYAAEIDYAPVLCACHRLQSLHLERSQDASAIVELFSESGQALWVMDVDDRDEVSVELRDDTQSRFWSFTCGYSARMSFIEPRLAACLTMLGHLTASPMLLVQLHNLVGWSRSLPALRSLTLKMLHSVPNSVPSSCANPPVSMPQLASFTLWLDDMSDEMQELLEHLLPALPALIERALNVVIDVDNADDLLTCNLEPLSAITEELRVRERSSGQTTVHAAPWSGLGLQSLA